MNCRPPLDEAHALRRWANLISGHYGHPVYLCGSWVKGKDDPRDIDVICVIPDGEFESRYGNVDKWITEGDTGLWSMVRWRWSDDCMKKWKHGQRFIADRGVLDFKVLPQKYHDTIAEKGVVYRLDTRVESLTPEP